MASSERTHKPLSVEQLRALAAVRPSEVLENHATRAIVERAAAETGGEGLMGLLTLAAKHPDRGGPAAKRASPDPQPVHIWQENMKAQISLAHVPSPPTPVAEVESPLAVDTEPEAPRRRTRGLAVAAGMTGLSVLAAAALALVPRANSVLTVRHAALRPQAAAPAALGQLIIESEPAGALIFLDGEPTGLRTPAELTAIPLDHRVEVRVEMAGFQSRQRSFSVNAALPHSLSFQLPPSIGLVQLVGMPPGADLYIDGVAVPTTSGEPTELPIGQHELRVELEGRLLFSADVPVAPGEQTFHVGLSPTER